MSVRLLKNVVLVYADRLRYCRFGGEARSGRGKQRGIVAGHRIDDVCRHLRASGFEVRLVGRDALDDGISSCDWVVALGGDGTQLDTARYAGNTPVLGLRLFPESSRGFLCSADYNEFLSQNIAVGDAYAVRAYMRMNCCVNGVSVGRPVLNDVLFSQSNPARASRYDLQYNRQSEFQCSSGVWVSTAVGSHGAVRSAGGPTVDRDARLAAFCVRERATPGELLRGTFEPYRNKTSVMGGNRAVHETAGDHFSIRAQGNHHRLFFDGGLWEYPLSALDVVSFSESDTDFRQILLRGKPCDNP